MSDPIIKYSEINENIRAELQEWLTNHGVMQKFVSRQVGLSNASISLFLNHRRELVPDKLEAIKSIITK